jgi:hypothetical protein
MKLVAIALFVPCCFGFEDVAAPSASKIMRRVAENQDREQNARREFVYEQKLHRTLRDKNGKLIREEFWTYSVTPGSKDTQKKFISVNGRYWKNGEYRAFDGLPLPDPGLLSITLDDEDSSSTRDGVDSDLFPLTSEQQKKYTFEMMGERVVKDRPAYRVQFHPTDRKDYAWTGEALIDKEEYQPVSIYTQLSRKLPLAVRTMLGTDVHGLGYNINYTRVDKDLWFPSTYGTEFSLRVLFLLNRTLTESTENMNFRRANVESSVEFAASPEK